MAQSDSRQDAWHALAVGVATALLYAPTVRAGFLRFGDASNFLANPDYRGLSAANLKWMLLRFQVAGSYQPVTWLTHGLDYLLWGMNPAGYHLGNVLLAAAGAAATYGLAARLLRRASAPEASEAGLLRLCAAFAALLFWVHPQRVEVVAWASQRGYLLAALFAVLSLDAYLKAHEPGQEERRLRRLALAAGFFVLSLLSKPAALGLPLLFLIADVYPLRRAEGPGRLRALAEEKAPLFFLSAATAVVAANGLYLAGISAPASAPAALLGRAGYAAAFYLAKMVAPARLAPFYPAPRASWVYGLAAAAVAGAAAAAFAGRRQRPWAWAALAAYGAALLPFLGLWPIDPRPRVAADKWFFLAALPWALLGAGLLFAAARRTKARGAWLAGAAALLAGLCGLTLSQERAWKDSDSLFARQMSAQPGCAYCEHEEAQYLAAQGRMQDAVRHELEAARVQPDYVEAVSGAAADYEALKQYDSAALMWSKLAELDPNDAVLHLNFGLFYVRAGRRAQAVAETRKALVLDPNLVVAHNNLGFFLLQDGRADEASRELEEALRLDPNNALARGNLAVAQAAQVSRLPRNARLASAHRFLDEASAALAAGRREDAVAGFTQATRYDPGSAPAFYDLGVAFMQDGRPADAAGAFQRAVALDPNMGNAHFNLGLIDHTQGRLSEAEREYREAIRCNPGAANANLNLGVLLTSQGRLAEADRYCSEAVRLDPASAGNTHCYRKAARR